MNTQDRVLSRAIGNLFLLLLFKNLVIWGMNRMVKRLIKE